MTTENPEPIAAAAGGPSARPVLLVVKAEAGFHLVSEHTLAAARAAQEEKDTSLRLDGFGDLRRSGSTDALDRALEYRGVSMEAYIGAIERSANRSPASEDLETRLAALRDVDFQGDDDSNAPSDSSEFRNEDELENEIEDYFAFTLMTGMCNDVPADVLKAFDAVYSPRFSEHRLAVVEEAHLEEMVSMLEARGFTIVRTDADSTP